MGLDHYYTFSEVISFLQKYKQKTIAHNGDNSKGGVEE
jgi:DNA polymerase sigma